MLTNEDIEYLIGVEKILIGEKFKTLKDKKSMNSNIDLHCNDVEGRFYIFTRQHEEFKDNYSIGLMYTIKGKKYNLIRVNGSETQHKIKHHRKPHEHILTVEDIKESRECRPSKIEYEISCVSFQDAILYFLKRANINYKEDYFSDLFEYNLFS